MKLKALKVKIPPQDDEDARGALLDSGATHVLRPAKDEQEHRTSKEVPVVLAGDEKRLLRQNPAGSIILNPLWGGCADHFAAGQACGFLGLHTEVDEGSLMLKHPRYGTIRTKIRAGCPEIADSVQAAALIAELEERRINELRQRTEEDDGGNQGRLEAGSSCLCSGGVCGGWFASHLQVPDFQEPP